MKKLLFLFSLLFAANFLSAQTIVLWNSVTGTSGITGNPYNFNTPAPSINPSVGTGLYVDTALVNGVHTIQATGSTAGFYVGGFGIGSFRESNTGAPWGITTKNLSSYYLNIEFKTVSPGALVLIQLNSKDSVNNNVYENQGYALDLTAGTGTQISPYGSTPVNGYQLFSIPLSVFTKCLLPYETPDGVSFMTTQFADSIFKIQFAVNIGSSYPEGSGSASFEIGDIYFSSSKNIIPPAPTVVGSISYCTGATATALSATGLNLNWYTVATGGTASAITPVPYTTTVGTTNYYVSQTLGGYESARAMIAVTVNAIPNAPVVTSPETHCQYSDTVLTASGSNLMWYTTATGGTGSTSAPAPGLVPLPGITDYYVTQTINGCESSRAMIEVTVNDFPGSPSVTASATYCLNERATPLSATGNALKWYMVATGGTASNTPLVPQTNTTGITDYYVTQSYNGCESNRAVIEITVNGPSAPTVTSPVMYCQNEQASALSATGASLNWYTTAIGGTALATAPIPSTIVLGSMNYYVSQTINGCEGYRASIDVIVNALPTVSIKALSNLPICKGSTIVLISGSADQYSWLFGTSQVGTNQTYQTSAAGNYRVVAINTAGCTDTSQILTVSVESQSCYDCANIFNGTAYTDKCGVCVAGTTGLTACTTGTLSSLGSTDLVVYPLPFENNTLVQFKNGGNIESISVYSTTGTLVYTKSGINSNEIEIGDSLSAGLYNVIIQTENGIFNTKIIKVK